ncbi:prepilin peptidase [Siccirubricoccus sp. G192]|uniref:A24 family peptidase n=1 Tax=Siccirubricoccus sp. G192 TaxID=2849651 RepID=UPI0020C5039F|nr:prepilin peptidase [Siccirubricoccus sp. G192]
MPVTLLLLAAWRDIATRTIPDSVSLALASFGLGLRASEGTTALAASAAIAALLFLGLVLLHARGALGGGDVKLASAIALGLPPLATFDFLLATALSGGVLALLYLVLRHLPAPVPARPTTSLPRRVLAAERWRIHRRGPLPYAVAIAAGGILTLIAPLGG